MADYPLISLLSQLDPATPSGSETPAKLDDSIRQIKDFIKTFLAVAHDDTGALKSGASSVASIPNKSITYAKIQDVSATDKLLGRSTAGSGTVEEVPCTAAGRAILDDADAAAQRTTLGLGAMATKATVATTDLDAGAVTTTKIAALAVTSNELASSAVTNAKIAAAAVDPTKISNIGDAKILAGDGTAGAALTVGGALTATRSGSTLVFALSGGSTSGFSATYALLEERLTNGSAAGGSTAASYVARSLTEQLDAGDMVGVSGGSVTLRKKGTYMIRGSAPMYAVGDHRVKIRQTSGTPADLLLGTSETAPASTQTRSFVNGIVVTTDDNVVIQLQHYAQNAVATNGMGHPVSAGEQEVYAQLEIFRL